MRKCGTGAPACRPLGVRYKPTAGGRLSHRDSMEDGPMAGLGMFFPTGGMGSFNTADSMARETANAAMQAAASQKSEIEVLREQVERIAL